MNDVGKSGPDRVKVPPYGGVAIGGAAVTGVLGWMLALVSILASHSVVASAVALVASAIAFGLLANAIFRE